MENNVKQPTIKTMTITVKVVKIGNSKMTLSVFDQILTGWPLDEDFNIVGTFWGKVKRRDEIFYLFEKDGELWKNKMKEPKFFLDDWTGISARDKKFRHGWIFHQEFDLGMKKENYWVTPSEFIEHIRKMKSENEPLTDEENDYVTKWFKWVQNWQEVQKTLEVQEQLFIAV